MKKKNAKVNTYISLDCTAYSCGHWNVENLTGRDKIIDKKVYYTQNQLYKHRVGNHQRFFGKDLSKGGGFQTLDEYCYMM